MRWFLAKESGDKILISTIMRLFTDFYDKLYHMWEKPASERRIGLALLWIYLITLGVVELKRLGYYPIWLPQPYSSHFYSIQLAFTLILFLEILSLIFIIPSSLASSMGKQMEILTLILLRNAFKELAILPEPVTIDSEDLMPVINIALSGLAALCVFCCLGVYRRISRRLPLITNQERMTRYVASKKILALCLLAIFTGIAAYDFWLLWQGIDSEFFETIYTTLIFADIAMVLIAQRYMPSYFAVFRNSGFVIGTLMMRLSLSAPALLSCAIAVFAGLYVVCLTWASNYFMPSEPSKH